MNPLVLLPLAFAPTPLPHGRQEVPVVSVADKVAELDALVTDLLAQSQPGQADADKAWAGLQAAKNRILEEERRWRSQALAAERANAARENAWVDAIQQIEDAAARAQALSEIDVALRSGDAEAQGAACAALTACAEVQFDKAPFGPLVRAIAASAQGGLRVDALYALYNTARVPADRELALALADDPSAEARVGGPHLVHLFCADDLGGPADAALVRMFSGSTYDQRRQMLSGLWGARVASGVEAYLLELSRSPDPNDQYDAMYYALSTFPAKSEAVVRRLIDFLPSTDPNRYQRVLWGLSYGVDAAQAPLVTEAVRSLFEARSDVFIQTRCLELLGQYAGADLDPWVAGIAADARRPQSVRDAAAAALEAMRAR